MDWNIERKVPFVPPLESSLSFLYNYNNYTYSGMEASEVAMGEFQQRVLPVIDDEMNVTNNGNDYGEKKKKTNTKNKKLKLTSNQVESLERSFQQEIMLEPDRKMKLSAELGLQPRQIAVWFQNRRTRWKTKQLEYSNDVLKLSCDVLKQENQKLKEVVVELKEKLKEKADFRTLTFGDETIVESPLEGSFIVEDFDSVSLHHECHWP